MITKEIKDYTANLIGANFDILDNTVMWFFEEEINRIVLNVIDKFDLRGYTEVKNEITIIALKEFINEKG
jgi:ethanolamine ammonia-lyase large subunit